MYITKLWKKKTILKEDSAKNFIANHKTGLDFLYKKLCIQVTSQVALCHKVRMLGNLETGKS